MNKKLLYIFAVLIFAVNSWAADQNIYLDNAGSGAGTIGDPYGAFSEINWTTGGTYSIYDWVAGGDDVYINLAKGATWRETYTPGTSGASGRHITTQAYGSGDDPIVSTADVNTSWTRVNDGDGIDVWEGGAVSGDPEFFYALDDGATERNTYFRGAYNSWASYSDRTFFGTRGNGNYYIGTAGENQNPGSVEIGTREHALEVVSKNYLTFIDIDFQGPNGIPTGSYTSVQDYGIVDITGTSTNIIIGDSESVLPDSVNVKYGTEGIRLYGGSVSNITVQKSTIKNCWGGFYIYHGNHDSDRNVLITDSVISNIAEVPYEANGDRAAIGCNTVRGIRVRKCYIHDVGSATMVGEKLDPAVNFAAAQDIEVSWCLIKDVAKGGLSCSNLSTETVERIVFKYNIIDNWAAFPILPASENHSGIRIGTTVSGASYGDMWIIGNVLTNASAPGASYNHAGIFFSSNQQTETGTFTISNNITNNLDNMDYEFYFAGGAYTDFIIKNNCFYQSGSTYIARAAVEHDVDSLNAAHANFADNIATTPDLDADYHLGASSTCDGNGFTLDAAYDDGIDEDTTWSPLSVTTSAQNTPWDIGALIYDTETPAGDATVTISSGSIALGDHALTFQ